jgi:hypothetical protein
LELTLPSISLRPSAGGLYYTGQWHCDEVLAKHIDTFGVAVSLVDMPGTDFATDTDTMWTESLGSEFTSGTKKCGVLINRILKDAATDIAFYAARYNKLLAAYGEEQEHGRYQIPEDKQEAFHKAVEELMNTESETRFSPVEISGELTGFTPKEVALLEPFIKIKE